MAVNHFLVTLTIRIEGENGATATLELGSEPFVVHGERGQVLRGVFISSGDAFRQLKTELEGKNFGG